MTRSIAPASAIKRQVLILCACLSVDILAACTTLPATAYSHPPVPALIPETIQKPPINAEPLIWQPGHWDWTGGGYVWANGQYVPAQGHGHRWVSGWWSRTPTGWVWQPPHWMS